jgi:hypothetical protein
VRATFRVKVKDEVRVKVRVKGVGDMHDEDGGDI